VPTKATLSLPLLNWTGERKYNERLVGRVKDRGSALSSYHQGQNTWLGEVNLIYYQSKPE